MTSIVPPMTVTVGYITYIYGQWSRMTHQMQARRWTIAVSGPPGGPSVNRSGTLRGKVDQQHVKITGCYCKSSVAAVMKSIPKVR